MHARVGNLSKLKLALEGKRGENTERRTELVELKDKYSDQNSVLANNQATKSQLLSATKNEEAGYQNLLSEREKAKAAFENELRDLESKLQFILDPNSIPTAGTQVFAWPLANPYITQYFGNTAFAQGGAYNGSGHNGMDFGVSRGTPILAALTGTVIATNEQVAYMCQYGKWVLVRHANGMTTLYAHLSVVSVSKGATVTTGQILGYSGDTGYATGPHLHFTVYASDAVNFKQYTCNSGATLTIPIAATTGYLNPMDYLPQ